MATQSVDYKTSILETDGLDTGEKEAAAVKPVINGEPGDAVVFNRPTENLRTRTEIARTELEDLKFLSDADRILALTSDGALTWTVTDDLGQLALASGKNLFVQPFLRVAENTPARTEYGDDVTHKILFSTVLEPTVGPPACLHPPRSYNGANQITLEIETVDIDATRVPVVTVTGSPARHIKISNVNVHATAGITCADFVSAMNLDTTLMTMGIVAALGPGGQGALKMQDAAVKSMSFKGAAEAELHKITDVGLAAFFAAAGDVNKMLDGDVLAIMYDALVEVTYGGRRQSLTSKPESTYAPDPSPVDRTDCSANLFLLRNHPEYLPLAIPLATRIGDQLLMINGKLYENGSSDYPYPGDFDSVQKAALLAGIGTPSAVPNNVNATTASATGVSGVFAKQDHIHQATTAPAVTLDATTTNAAGDSSGLARANHTHAITTATAVAIGADSSSGAGDSAGLARANHTHSINKGASSASQAPDNVAAEGSGDAMARASHVHQFAVAVDGDVANVGAASASAGTTNKFARADHRHKINFGSTPADVGATGTATPGTSETAARSDHVHALGANAVNNSNINNGAVTNIKVDANAAIDATKLHNAAIDTAGVNIPAGTVQNALEVLAANASQGADVILIPSDVYELPLPAIFDTNTPPVLTSTFSTDLLDRSTLRLTQLIDNIPVTVGSTPRVHITFQTSESSGSDRRDLDNGIIEFPYTSVTGQTRKCFVGFDRYAHATLTLDHLGDQMTLDGWTPTHASLTYDISRLKTYLGRVFYQGTRQYQIRIHTNGSGIPDLMQWRVSTDGGSTWSTWEDVWQYWNGSAWVNYSSGAYPHIAIDHYYVGAPLFEDRALDVTFTGTISGALDPNENYVYSFTLHPYHSYSCEMALYGRAT